MDSGRSSLSKRGSTDPLWDLLENLKQNPIPGLFYSSSTDNSVVLYDWWLVTSNVEGESKGLAVAGYIAKKESQFPFISSPIVKRHDTYTLEAADGVTVKVEGMINQNKTRKNGFSHEICVRFNLGFPIFWKQYIDSFADTTSTPGTNPSQILEQFETGTGNILNPNLESADPIGIDDDTLGDSPGIITTKEFEPVPDMKTSGKGSRQANMVHGATDPLSESNIRRSRSETSDADSEEKTASISEGSSKKKYRPGKYTSVTNKCVVDVAMNFLNSKVLHLLMDKHIELLLRTPFLHLFVIPKGVIASNGILQEIVEMWDSKDCCFKYGPKKLYFTAKEVSLVMSLPNLGKNVSHVRIATKKSVLRNRHFPNMATIKRSTLENAIEAAVADVGCPAEEVVGLLIMYIFTTILFPQAGGNVPMHLFLYLDNVCDLHLYNWGQAVFELLMMHIPTVSKWCLEKKATKGHEQKVQTSGTKGVKRKRDKQEKGQKYPSGYLPGCALALIVWFLEHAQMSSLEPNTGRVPRYLSWLTALSKNYQRRGFKSELKKHNVALVNERTLEPSYKEKKMIEAGFIASSHMFIICNEEEMKARSEKSSIYSWLLEMVPVYMKFGVKPCEFLRVKFEEVMDNYVYVDQSFATRDYLSSDSLQNMIVQFGNHSSRKVSSHILSQKKTRRQMSKKSQKKSSPITQRKIDLSSEKDMTQDEAAVILRALVGKAVNIPNQAGAALDDSDGTDIRPKGRTKERGYSSTTCARHISGTYQRN